MDVRSPLFQNVATLLIGVMFLNPILATAAELALDAAGGNTHLGQAANGVPIVNIATPNGSSLSHNKFSDYNVGQQGLILNNATDRTQSTQLGGIILGNPNLRGGAAGLILNEVTGGNSSQLKGYTEVAGQGAHVIVANPHGVTCNGCGFINTPHSTLTTGKPVIDNGRLSRFDVDGGAITIEGAGLNASNVEQFDLITRSAKINAEIYANRLNVITGRNQVDASTLAATAKADNGSEQPQLAIDSSALGGMYAGAIRLVGTEAGVGVKLAGDMAASAGDIQIDANGHLNLAQTAASGDIKLLAASAELNGKTYAGGSINAQTAAGLVNQQSLAAREGIELNAAQLSNSGLIEAGVEADNSRNIRGDVKLVSQSVRNSGSVLASRDLGVQASQHLDNQDGTLSAQSTQINAGQLDNRQGRVLAGGALKITAGSVDNSRNGLLHSQNSTTVETTGSLNNQSGRVIGLQSLSAKTGVLDNSQGGLLASQQQLSVNAGSLNNQTGEVSGNAIDLQVGSLNNSNGKLIGDQLKLTAAAQVDNRQGQIQASRTLELAAASLDNSGQGTLLSQGGLALQVNGLLDNHDLGNLISHGTQQLKFALLDNSHGGLISSKNTLDLQGATLNNQSGLVVADGALTIKGGSLDNRQQGNVSGMAAVQLELTQLNNSGGSLASRGDMQVSTQALLDNSNNGALLASGDLRVSSGSLNNSDKGLLSSGKNLQLNSGATNNSGGQLISQAALDVHSGDLNNQGGALSSKQNLSLQTRNLDNSAAGLISSAGELSINAQRLDSSFEGEISAKGNLLLRVTELVQRQGRLIGEQAVTLNLAGGKFDNRGGLLSAHGPLSIQRLAELDNRDLGEISSQQSFSLLANRIDNGEQGRIISADTLSLNAATLRNAHAGLLSGWQGLTLQGVSLDNSAAGTLSSKQGALTVNLTGALDNFEQGALVSQGLQQVSAASLNNVNGILSSDADLDLNISGGLNNSANGLISAKQDLRLNSLSTDLNNQSGELSGAKVLLKGNSVNNSRGQISSQGALEVSLLGALINANHARLASGGALILNAGSVDNRSGQLISQNALTLTAASLDNSLGGTLASQQDLQLNLTGDLSNQQDGLIYSQLGKLLLTAGSLNNHAGTLQSATDSQLRITGALNNQHGQLSSQGGNLDLQAGSLDNSSGGILSSAHGWLKLLTAGLFDNHAGTTQAQSLELNAAQGIDNRNGHLSAVTGDNLIVTQDFSNQGGGLYAGTLLKVTGQQFLNQGAALGQGGKVGAGQVDFGLSGALNNQFGIIESDSNLSLNASSINNMVGSLRALGRTGSTHIASNSLNNNYGVIDSANHDLDLQVVSLSNGAGRILHTGIGNFGLSADNVMQAGGSLTSNGVLTLNAANWVNSSVLQAGHLNLNIGNFSQTAEGQLLAAQSFKGTGNTWVNNGLLASDGNFTLNLSGGYSGDGRLSSLGTLSLSAASIALGEPGRISSGGNGQVSSSGTLSNYGRLTSAADLRINAANLANYGTLGSAGALRLTAPALLNEHGLIFSGADMALRVNDFTNKYADVYSLGGLDLAADDQGIAAARLDNLSGTIESVGNMSLRAMTINNARDLLTINNAGKYTAKIIQLPCRASYGAGDCSGKRNGVWEITERDKLEVLASSAAAQLLAGGSLSINAEQLLNSSSLISAATNIQALLGRLENQGVETGETETKRVFISQRTRNIGSWNNEAKAFTARYWLGGAGYNPSDLSGLEAGLSHFINRTERENTAFRTTTVLASGDQSYAGIIQAGGDVSITASQQINNAVIRPFYTYVSGGSKVGNTGVGSNVSTQVSLNAQLPPGLAQQQINPVTLPGFSLPTGQNGLFRLSGQNAQNGVASAALGGAADLTIGGRQIDLGQRAPVVGNQATSVTGVQGLPNSSKASNSHKYLIETNPALTDLKQFMSSDYLLGLLGVTPDNSQKRLGDGLYEQRLIREAVVARTGQRFLAGLTSDEAMFRYLMDNAIASKQALNLSVGVTLSASQVAALTHDLVWLEEALVNGEKVLVPVLYLAQAKNRLAPNGALIQGQNVSLIAGKELNNAGTLRASNNLSASASNISNSGLMEAGQRLDLLAQDSIRNAQGGIISGRDVRLTALTGDVLNERTVTRHQSVSGNSTWERSFADSAARIEASNRLDISAGRDIANLGGVMQSRGNLSLNAGRDVSIASVEQRNSQTRGSRYSTSNVTQLGAEVSAGRDLTTTTSPSAAGSLSINAGRDLSVIASKVEARNDLDLIAGRDVTLAAAANEEHFYSKSKKVTRQEDHVRQQSTEVNAGGDVFISSGQDLTLLASKVEAGQEAYLVAGNNLELLSAEDQDYSYYLKTKTSKSGLSSTKKTRMDSSRSASQVASLVSADKVIIQADQDIGVSASDVVSTNGTLLEAGRNVLIDGAIETSESSHAESKKKSGVMSSGGIGFTIGSASAKSTQSNYSEQLRGSTIGSVLGNVEIQASKDLTIRGSDVVAGQDVQLSGQNVNILAAQNNNRSEQTHKSKTGGLTLALSGTVGSAVDSTYQTVKQARGEDDSRLSALQGIKAGLTGVQAWQATQQGGGMNSENAGQFVGISASLGSQKSSSKQVQEQSVSQGSTLSAGNNLSIRATGSEQGQDGDIRIQGSQLKAGNDLILNAQRNVVLEAAANTQKLDGKSKSSGGAVGASLGVGPQGGGLSVFASVNQGAGKEKGNGTAWSETTLDAGHQVTLVSGRDTALKGAQVSGERVVADVGRDLTLQSLQDNDDYKSRQKNVSAGASVAIIGVGGGANLSASQSEIDSKYSSVQEQTGLFAGKGGFEIEVGKHTQLDGAVIASTAEAERNRLSTDTLGWSDIRNKADYQSQQQSVSVSGANSGSGGFTGNMPSGVLVAYTHGDSARGTTASAISGGNIEIRDPAKQQQDVTALSRDTEHANGSISPIFDKEKEQQRLQQVQLIAEIGNQSMDILRTQGELNADEAARKELAKQGNSNPSAEQVRDSAAYKKVMSEYGTGSDLQRAAQAVTAALQGLVGGDIGSALAGASAPYLAQLIKQQVGDNDTARIMAHAVLGAVVAQAQGNSAAAGAAGAASGEAMAMLISKALYAGVASEQLSEEQKQTVSALATLAAGLAGAAAAGDAAGALAGAQGGKNAVENNWLSTQQKADYAQELAEAETFVEKIKVMRKWNVISLNQDLESTKGIAQGVTEGLAGTGVETLNGVATFMRDPVEQWGNLKDLASTDAVRQILGTAYDAFQQELREIDLAIEYGGDQNAKALGYKIGSVLSTVVAALATGGSAKAAGLSKVGITLKAEQAGELAASAGQKIPTYLERIKKTGYNEDVPLVNGAKGVGQALREVEISSGNKGSWTKELNKPEPNTIYKVDGNKAYQTDSLGRVERVESNLSLTKNDRNTYQQCVAGKCGASGDEGGHLIASIFNGPGERLNLLPMNGNLNKGAWKAMENSWASALKQGQTVGVKIDPVYSGSSVRPDRFTVRYSIDGGRPVIIDFKNSPGGI